jgi:hypothetical protein
VSALLDRLPFGRRRAGGTPYRELVLDYADDLRLFRGPWRKAGLALLLGV